MKTVLIPTDFSTGSLGCIVRLAENYPDERFEIILFHVFKLSDSINDLLLLSRREKEHKTLSAEYKRRCKELHDCYPRQIHRIGFECFYGSTLAVFKNYLEANRAELIAYDPGYTFRKPGKNSVDPKVMIRRCKYPVLKLNAPAGETSGTQPAASLPGEKTLSY